MALFEKMSAQRAAAGGVLACLLLLVIGLQQGRAKDWPTIWPRVWSDYATGFAIGGFDPVDYFVLGKPSRPEMAKEALWGGLSWRFRNEGNRQAFLLNPLVYAPRFGGADPYLLVRHKGVAGNPNLFAIYQNRLYLFYNRYNLRHWKKHKRAYTIQAQEAWPRAASMMRLDPADDALPNGQN